MDPDQQRFAKYSMSPLGSGSAWMMQIRIQEAKHAKEITKIEHHWLKLFGLSCVTAGWRADYKIVQNSGKKCQNILTIWKIILKVIEYAHCSETLRFFYLAFSKLMSGFDPPDAAWCANHWATWWGWSWKGHSIRPSTATIFSVREIFLPIEEFSWEK